MLNRLDLRRAIAEAELSGLPVCAHTSLSSFGYIEGGAAALVDAYLDEGCTLLVPTFVYGTMVYMPEGCEHRHNGMNAGRVDQLDLTKVPLYDPTGNDISESMGAVPREVLSRAGRVRGNHPINPMAAVGPLAEDLVSCQSCSDVYAPYARAAELGGMIALMGVGLKRCTPIHWAEQCSGMALFVRWSLDQQRQVIECTVGSCSEGFEQLAPVVEPYERRCQVGESLWRIMPLRESMAAVSQALKAQPGMAHCEDPECVQCHDKALGGLIRGGGA